jgi:hypothetical protein
VNDEIAATAGFGMRYKAATVFFDDPPRGGQAQSRAAGFVRDIGMKDLIEFVRRDPGAGVDDVNAGFAIVWTSQGFPFQPESSYRTVLACFPFMFIYTVSLSILTHQMSGRII